MASASCKGRSGNRAPELCKVWFGSCKGQFGRWKGQSGSCKGRSGNRCYWVLGLRHYVKGGLAVLSFDPVVVLGRSGTCAFWQCDGALWQCVQKGHFCLKK
ncbi:hypothetical protein AMTRI_Chr02g218400 [Amborella trichopoda]